jgi:hypothetical protein
VITGQSESSSLDSARGARFLEPEKGGIQARSQNVRVVETRLTEGMRGFQDA